MTTYTLGIDPGLACTAWALAEHHPVKPRIIAAGASVCKASEGDTLYRIRRHVEAVRQLVADMAERPHLIMEISFADFGRNVRSATETALLVGLIIGSAEDRVKGWELVAPATWATQCLGAGNKKPDRFTMEQIFDVADPKRMLANEHKRDACCIAGWGARR